MKEFVCLILNVGEVLQPPREAENLLYNDDCIFTPKVKVFKSDIHFPGLLPEAEWWEVDVITSKNF